MFQFVSSRHGQFTALFSCVNLRNHRIHDCKLNGNKRRTSSSTWMGRSSYSGQMSIEPYLRYLKTKYGELYKLS